MKLALFTNKFPIREATFFARDVRGLLAAGVMVDVYSMRGVDAGLWKWVPDILDERALPRERVRGIRLRGGWKWILPSALKGLPRFVREAAAIDASALRFGGGPLVKSTYAIALGWAWAQKYGTVYDHIMSYWGNYAATSAYLAHRLSGREIPFSILLHAGTDLYRDQVYMERKLEYADNIFTVCEYNRDFLRSQFPRTYPRIRHKIRIHHLGLDFARLPFAAGGRRNDTVLCVGRFDRLKGFDYVIRAVAELRRRGLDPSLELVGDGDEAGALMSLAGRLGLGDRVRFPGWLPFAEVQRAMSQATLLAHASSDIGDAVPTVIKEAEALGLPVVGSRIAGIPELLDQGRCGMLVPPRDVDALADAMETLMNDGALRDSLALAARHFAEEKFDLWESGRALARDLAATRRSPHVVV